MPRSGCGARNWGAPPRGVEHTAPESQLWGELGACSNMSFEANRINAVWTIIRSPSSEYCTHPPEQKIRLLSKSTPRNSTTGRLFMPSYFFHALNAACFLRNARSRCSNSWTNAPPSRSEISQVMQQSRVSSRRRRHRCG